jgi:protein-S-isoprenylcysteine O-methyltransferase Ste14
VIRAPHGKKSRELRVVENRKGPLEILLVAFVSVSMVVFPIVGASGLLAFADYELHPIELWIGAVLLMVYFWLFHRSHADLGANWSVSLQLREDHKLVTGGVYSRIRHPMYTAFFLYGFAQLLLLPNWIAGPSFLVAWIFLYVLRIEKEERMMRERFGALYTEYMARTKRLVPFLY